MTWLTTLRAWAKRLKRDVVALWLAAGDERVPWYAKAAAAVVAAYALSPIDLIPDFIPILGYLDDAILLPIGIALTIQMIPAPVMADLRARANELTERPRSTIAAIVVNALWLIVGVALTLAAWTYYRRRIPG